ncbi:MAG: hypothetical protein J6P16_05320 [Eubacterium sp.]|nr:hypothetical protein [Eubacterium sp.]
MSSDVKKNSDRITSPEKLDKYIKVIRPSMWVMLGAVIAVVLIVVIWSISSSLTIKVNGESFVNKGVMSVVVDEDAAQIIQEGAVIKAGGKTTTVKKIEIDTLQSDMTNYIITADSDLKDGIYKAEIETDGVSPFSYVFG